MKIILDHVNYKLLKYEVEFLEKEIQRLVSKCDGCVLESSDSQSHTIDIPSVNIEIFNKLAKRLTYIRSVRACDESCFIEQPMQALYEESCHKTGSQKRQTTRYGAHGLHEYKGKFNPQIVSAIANIFDLRDGDKVLEPFCGSGTTLYQSELIGMKSNGFDFNPLAVYITNTKLASLSLDADVVLGEIKDILEKIKRHIQNAEFNFEKSERSDYLQKWFDIDQLKKIEILKTELEVSTLNNTAKDVCFCVASDLIRDYSLQEPADLRIRRRKSPLPIVCFYDALLLKVEDFLKRVESISPYAVDLGENSKAFNIDIRDTAGLMQFHDYDAAITSPPYATALPYIDTQRLSLVWLGFASPKEVKILENNLIGSRELTKKEERFLREQIETNADSIPDELHSLCLEMLESLGDTDGFRRQAMPFVVYRYFVDMKLMFSNVLNMIKPMGKFGLVVGHNQTTLGGRLFLLDTPNYLRIIAESVGWASLDNIKLDVYKRYDLHKANSINVETLLVLQKPA
ncbi:hypothetical protein ACED34_24925 [Vibrio splendidus]|uniref:hypothetical protein n=1 Tax=Vibrio splendidus TaxID=29497 RepID=UPI00352BD582